MATRQVLPWMKPTPTEAGPDPCWSYNQTGRKFSEMNLRGAVQRHRSNTP